MNPSRDIDWSAAVDVLGAALPTARWPQRLREWLADEPGEVQQGDCAPWCVALSGGADSVALLLALAAQRGQLRQKAEGRMRNGSTEPRCTEPKSSDRSDRSARAIRNPQSAIRNFLALHFNHRLRGAAADADEVYCRELCAALGVKLVVGAANWPAGSEVSEAQAREARFAFFGDAMAEVGARALWLGQHRDDVVETMLLRLSRGSGSRGLAAPRPVQRMADGSVRLRPLLNMPKADLVAALRVAGIPWCEDQTNHGDAYFRNRLRRLVVPAWAEAAPADLAEAVARSRALLEEEDDALELWADRVLPAQLDEVIPLAALREAPVAVVRRALHRWMLAVDLSEALSRSAFEELLAAVCAGREAKLSVGVAGFLIVDGTELRLQAAETQVPRWSGAALEVPGEIILPDGAKLRAAHVQLDPELRRRICAGAFGDARTVFFAAMETFARLSIRSWQPGDRYVPLGAAQSSKLQDQFVNRRVPRQLRQRLPVVCAADGTIVWVPGLPPAHGARISDGTLVAVQLTYLPAAPLSASLHV
jgi:tRNA(Ile)-lysidine synthase